MNYRDDSNFWLAMTVLAVLTASMLILWAVSFLPEAPNTPSEPTPSVTTTVLCEELPPNVRSAYTCGRTI